MDDFSFIDENICDDKEDNILRRYVKDLSKYPLLDEEEINRLIKIAQGENSKEADRAIETIILSNIRLVIKFANKTWLRFKYNSTYRVAKLDLVAEGMIILTNAIRRYNLDVGSAKFTSYATSALINGMRDYVQTCRLINIPGNHYWQIAQVKRLKQNNSSLSDQAIYKKLGISAKLAKRFDHSASEIVDIDMDKLLEFMPQNDNMENRIANKETMIYVMEKIEKLDEMHKDIVISHFFKDETLGEIGERYGVTKQAIFVRIKNAIRIIKNQIKKERYNEKSKSVRDSKPKEPVGEFIKKGNRRTFQTRKSAEFVQKSLKCKSKEQLEDLKIDKAFHYEDI